MTNIVRRNANQIGFGALLLATFVLSAAARGSGESRLDLRVQQFIQRAPETPFRWFADFGNWIGSAAVCAVIGFLVFVLLLIRRRPAEATIILISHAARVLNGVLKALFDSPRPASGHVRVDEIADGLGFPSGHAMGATLCFGSIALIFSSLIEHRTYRRAIQIGCICMIGLVGFGRIFVGAHWPSDVLGGYLYGTIILFAIFVCVTRCCKRRHGSMNRSS